MGATEMGYVVDQWDAIFRKRASFSRYPFSDLVGLVKRFQALLPDRPRVLECGFGAGPNIDFFVNEGFEYEGIEGSAIAFDEARKRYAELPLRMGDLTDPFPYSDGSFDLVVDRSVITHNRNHLELILREVWRILRPSGLFIGVDWFSREHEIYLRLKERESEDRFHHAFFGNEEEIKGVFSDFEILFMKYKSDLILIPEKEVEAYYDIVVRKWM